MPLCLLPENPMNSSSLMTRAGSSEIIRLNVPMPMRTPLSKCTFDVSLVQLRPASMLLHSLKLKKHVRIFMPPLMKLASVSSSMNVSIDLSSSDSAMHSSACTSSSLY